MLGLMESGIWDVVTEDCEKPGNARKRTKFVKDKAKAAYIIKPDVSDALFLHIEDDNNPESCWTTLGQDIVRIRTPLTEVRSVSCSKKG